MDSVAPKPAAPPAPAPAPVAAAPTPTPTSVDIEVEVEALDELDIVDITEPGEDVDLEADLDQPPASAPRPIAGSLDEALASAAAPRDVAKTPPPESGPEPAVALPAAAVVLREVASDDSLEADLGLPPLPSPRAAMPTMEQLGSTVDLEESHDGPTLDLAPQDIEPPKSRSDDLEMELPSGGRGVYDDSLRPPPSAQEDLARHLEREASRSGQFAAVTVSATDEGRSISAESGSLPAPSLEKISSPPTAAPVPATPAPVTPQAATPQVVTTTPDAGAAVRPVVTTRSATEPSYVADYVTAAKSAAPRTFLQALDQSLALGKS